MKQLQIIIDDYVKVGNKKIALNLNTYRNLHHQVNNKAKQIFKRNLLAEYPELATIKAYGVNINYVIYPNNYRKFDTMNVISIVDKYFMDALVEIGCIPDDDYQHVSYKKAPRVANVVKNPCKKISIFCDFF